MVIRNFIELKPVWASKKYLFIDIYDMDRKLYVGDGLLTQNGLRIKVSTYITSVMDEPYDFAVRFATVKPNDEWKFKAVMGSLFCEARKEHIDSYEEACSILMQRLGDAESKTEKELKKKMPL